MSTVYPDIEVGDIVSADLLDSMLPIIASKTTSTTRTSTTTVADDPDLVLPVVANASYIIEFYIRYGAITAGGFKTAWTVPSGVTTSSKDVHGPGSSAADTNADNISVRMGNHSYANQVSYGTRNNNASVLHAHEYAIVTTGATAGNVTLQWAQTTSSGTGTIVYAGSFAKAVRVG